MIIGFTGAHSTGKTTLLMAMKEDKRFADYEFATEIARSLNLPINDDAEDYNNTQRALIDAHVKMLENAEKKKIITDRTMLDVCVYTTYLFLQRKVTISTLLYVLNIFSANKHKYDIVFYIRPEFDIVDDGVRSTKASFRESIAGLFETFFKNDVHFKSKTKILTGTVQERLLTIVRRVFDYD